KISTRPKKRVRPSTSLGMGASKAVPGWRSRGGWAGRNRLELASDVGHPRRPMDFPTYIDVIARRAPADWHVESGPLLFQPNPGPTSPYEAPRRKCAIARLVHQITNPMRDFDDYFGYANIMAIDEYWPL